MSSDQPPPPPAPLPPVARLGAFTHLPSYDFDFDYRGHTIRPSLPTTDPSHLTNYPSISPSSTSAAPPPPPPPPYTSPLVDDFDSYMFPDAPYSPTDAASAADTLQTITTATSPNSPSPAPTPRSTPPPSAGPPTSVVTPSTSPTSAGAAASSTTTDMIIDWHAVDAARLYAPDGAILDPCTLYTGYSTLVALIFVPRHSVELCALVYAKLAHLLQQASTRVVFVTAWTPQQARTFLSRFERVTPFPGSVVCDPHATLFSAFGFTRSPLRALFASTKVSAPMRQGVRNAFSTVTYRAQNRDIATTAVSSKRLKVGAVVLPALRGYAKRPMVMYGNEEGTQTGVGCYMDVLSTCGVNDAFVPEIDVSQLYARFNSMRATSMKARSADEKEANRLRNAKHRGSRKSGDRRNALKT